MLRICSLLVLICLPALALADFSGRVRVIDADTIDVGKVRVRLHAIDAPEMDQTCMTAQGDSFDCGLWVAGQVIARFQGRTATCTPTDTDSYGRTVARCRADGVDMGQEIVAQGWAFAYRQYGMDYDLDEKSAYVADRGLHGFSVQSPAAFRQAQRQTVGATREACVIKGNISKNGYIFHVPGQEYYEQTGIDTARGERWFCTPAEARAAGWRAARR